MNTSTHTGLRKGRPTIGFFNNEIGRDWALWPWLGMVDTARKYDVNLVTFIGKNMRWAKDFAVQANVLYALANGERLDGLIIWKAGLVMSVTEPEIEEFCKRYGVPVVTLEEAVREWPCVIYGNYQGMRAAVDHLIEVHGYRRIGFVGMHEHHIGFQERYRAYTDALTAHGLPVEAKLTRPWFPDEVLLPPAGLVDEQVLSSWLKGALTAGVEAIVGVCDTTTIQILNTLQALGVSVPGEIALVSFDDFTGSRVITPPLTTVMPSWYELGQSAVETLVGILEGKPAPEQVAVTPRLMVRQSCGCLDPAVAQAAAGPVKRVAQAKAWETAFNRGEVATEMVQAARADAVEGIHQEVERLVESFMAEVTGEGAGGFLRELDGVLRRVSANGGNVAGWQNAFSVLRRQVLPWLGEGEVAARAEDLWQQARVVIGERTERALAYRQLLAEQHANQLREVGQTLNTTFDVGELMDELAENLPHLGIPGCYLSLYEEPRPYKYPDPAPEWSHLVLAYNERGRVKLEPGGRRFHSRQWVPEGMLPQDRCYSFVVEPLYFRESQIGFVLFEVGPREGGVYEVLRREISSALQGILLTQQVQHRALQLQTAAEVSSAASSILDLDKLLQQVVNLIHERFNLYYVGLFLVDETQRYAVLCAGTGEAGRQTLEAGHKLEVGSASPIGWCIAHGQARIASDVGAEAVRLKNPLLPATRSEMALPLVARGQTIGAMTIQSDQPAAFAPEDATALQTMAGQIANAIENVRLLAERKRAEESLAEERNLLRALIDNAPDYIYVKDTHSQFITCNLSLARLVGASTPDELLGKTDFDFFPQELAAQYYADEQALFQSGQPLLDHEEPTTDTLGNMIWVSTIKAPLRDTQGKIFGLVGMGRDITGLKRVQKALERRAAQLALLSEVGKKIAAVLELESVLDRAAHLVQENFGYYHVSLFTVCHEQGELVMRARAGDFAHLFPLDHRVKLGQGMVGWVGSHGERLLANDVCAEPHYINFYPDLIPTRSELAVPIRVGEETVGVLDVQSPRLNAFHENDVMVLETLADQIAVAIENARLYEAVQRELAERKRAEEQLERYSAELAQSNEELKRFNYFVSHNLRAPLVNLKGFAAELISSVNVIRSAFEPLLPQMSEKQRAEVSTVLLEDVPEALSFIDASVTRMDHFINALLKLSRLGRRELNLERVNMNALVRGTLETLAHQIKQHQMQVTIGPLPEVVADRTSMEQILGNILDNAIIYLEPGRPGEIEITGERNANEALFRIRDNGRGVAQEDMDKVFAPFRRAGKQDVPGEGMGLAYVQALVRCHGGRIWCESELGVGTTFAFSISNQLMNGDNHA